MNLKILELIDELKILVQKENLRELVDWNSRIGLPMDKTQIMFWEGILHATWGHDPYLEIVTEILYKKYPIEAHEDHSDLWADPVVKSESEMRELIEKLETYWKGHVQGLFDELYATQVDNKKLSGGIAEIADKMESADASYLNGFIAEIRELLKE